MSKRPEKENQQQNYRQEDLTEIIGKEFCDRFCNFDEWDRTIERIYGGQTVTSEPSAEDMNANSEAVRALVEALTTISKYDGHPENMKKIALEALATYGREGE